MDGRLVGAFVKSTLKGLLWYNPASLRTGTPHSFDELVGMARVVTKGPMKTWCVGLESAESSGWPGTDWIESFLLRDAGLETYDAWVRGDLAWLRAWLAQPRASGAATAAAARSTASFERPHQRVDDACEEQDDDDQSRERPEPRRSLSERGSKQRHSLRYFLRFGV